MAQATTAVTPARWPISKIAVALIFCASLPAGTGPTMAGPPVDLELVMTGEPVDLELVIAIDMSSSVDQHEYRLQMGGIAKAFRDPSVHDAIQSLALGKLAVMVMQWSVNREQPAVTGWHAIHNPADAMALADELHTAHRAIPGGQSSIDEALEFAMEELATNGFDGTRRVIIFSGDGRTHHGVPPVSLRYQAATQGVAVNGLAILNGEPFFSIDAYFKIFVTGGPGAFHMTASDYRDFAAVVQQMLRRVIGMIDISHGSSPEAARQVSAASGKENLSRENPPLPPGRQVRAALLPPACPVHQNLQLVEVAGAKVWHPNEIPEQVESLPERVAGAFRSRIWMHMHPIWIPTQCRGSACRLCPEPLRVDLRIEPIAIVYDSSATVGSCHYLKVREHERTHAIIAKRVESHHRARIQRELTDLVLEARGRTIAADEVQHTRQGLLNHIKAATNQARAAMRAGNKRAQELIHTAGYRAAERSAVRNCLVTRRYQAPPFPHLDAQTISGMPRSSQRIQ